MGVRITHKCAGRQPQLAVSTSDLSAPELPCLVCTYHELHGNVMPKETCGSKGALRNKSPADQSLGTTDHCGTYICAVSSKNQCSFSGTNITPMLRKRVLRALETP